MINNNIIVLTVSQSRINGDESAVGRAPVYQKSFRHRLRERCVISVAGCIAFCHPTRTGGGAAAAGWWWALRVVDAIAAAVVVVGVVVGGGGDRTQTQPFCSPPLATCRAPSPLTPPRHPLSPCAVSPLPLYLYTKYIVIIFCHRTSPPRYKHNNFI